MRIQKLIVCVFIALIGSFCSYSNVFYYFDQKVQDAVYQEESAINTNIKVIKIDQKTLDTLGTFGTWDRSVYAQLIEILDTEYAPYFIGFDILFSGTISEDGDQAFVDAAKDFGNVAVVNLISFEDTITEVEEAVINVDNMSVEFIEQPFSALQEVTLQGFSNAIIDDDSVVRRSLYSIDYEDSTYYSFAAILANQIAENTGVEIPEINMSSSNVFGFSYVAKSCTYEEVSLIDVLDGTVDVRSFKDCYVLVGAHASGMQDAYNVAIEMDTQMYGVEIHINIAESILNGSTVLTIDSWLHSLILFVFIFVSSYLVMSFTVLKGAMTTVVINIIYFIACKTLYNNGLSIPLLVLPVISFLVWVLYTVFSYFVVRKKQRETIQMFETYVSPQVVKKVIANKEDLEQVNSQTKHIAVLFIDVRGFTTLSERLSPEEVVDILNGHFNIITNVIFDNLGTVDKFMGDAAMAVFNSPFDVDDYIYRAVKCAVELREACKESNKYTLEKYGHPFMVGVGVHIGEAVVGNIGSVRHLDYTAIGDTVNTASRLESNAQANQILVSQEVVDALGNRVIFNALGYKKLKGKQEETLLYEVVSLGE